MPLLGPTELESTVATIVDRLRPVFSPVAVYLYGSYAYGQPHPDGDVDLIVVVEDSPLDVYSRDALAYKAVGAIGVSKDIQIYTRRELEERAAMPLSFERTVKEKGRLLYAA